MRLIGEGAHFGAWIEWVADANLACPFDEFLNETVGDFPLNQNA